MIAGLRIMFLIAGLTLFWVRGAKSVNAARFKLKSALRGKNVAGPRGPAALMQLE